MTKSVTMTTVNYFRRLVAMELSGRQSDHKYTDIVRDLFATLKLNQTAVAPVHLAGERPPPWVARYPDLAFLWERGHAAYLEQLKLRRDRAAPFGLVDRTAVTPSNSHHEN